MPFWLNKGKPLGYKVITPYQRLINKVTLDGEWKLIMGWLPAFKIILHTETALKSPQRRGVAMQQCGHLCNKIYMNK